MFKLLNKSLKQWIENKSIKKFQALTNWQIQKNVRVNKNPIFPIFKITSCYKNGFKFKKPLIKVTLEVKL